MANINLNGQQFSVKFKSTDWLAKFNGNDPLKGEQCVKVKGANQHPWAKPIASLYGDWVGNPDFHDFFCDTSKKKTVKQLAVSWKQMVEILEQAWDDNSESFNLKHSAFTDVDGWVAQGAAFVTEELNATTSLLKTHYGIVSVASGFAWSAIGINLMALCKCTKWEIPMIAEATQVALWPIYEELGLGGINELAVEFHGLIQLYSRQGKFYKDTVNTLSPEVMEIYQDTIIKGEKNFLQAVYIKLLRSIDLEEELVCSDEVWENILMFAHIRSLAQSIAKGRKLTEWQKNTSYGALTPERLQFVACATAVMRDGAKGRLGLEAEQEAISGCLAALLVNPSFIQLQKMKKAAFANPRKYNLASAVFTLVETAELLEVWQKQRYRLLNAE
jgi:hypothetical protein